MDVDKENLNKLSDEELFKTMKKCGLNVGPITSTTRSVYEKKLRNYLDSLTNTKLGAKSASMSRSQQLKQQEDEQRKRDEELERQREREEELERERQLLREQRKRDEELRKREEEIRKKEEELEYERQRQREEELRKREIELEKEKKRQREEELRRKEEELERERQKQRDMERERQRLREQKLREEELERQRQREQKHREEELERQRQREEELEKQRQRERKREEELEKERQKELSNRLEANKQTFKASNIPVRDTFGRSNSREIPSIYPILPNANEQMGARAKPTAATSRINSQQYQDQTYERITPTANHLRSIAISKESASNETPYFSNEYYGISRNELPLKPLINETARNLTSTQYSSNTSAGGFAPAPISPPRDKFAERLSSYGILKNDVNNSLYTSTLSSPTGIRARPPLHSEKTTDLYNSDNVYSATTTAQQPTLNKSTSSKIKDATPFFQFNLKYVLIVFTITALVYFMFMQLQNNPANPIG